jgi:hypothetical protein
MGLRLRPSSPTRIAIWDGRESGELSNRRSRIDAITVDCYDDEPLQASRTPPTLGPDVNSHRGRSIGGPLNVSGGATIRCWSEANLDA